LWDAAERSARDGGAAGSVSALKDLLSRLAQQNGVEIPLDKPKASVLCTLASDEIEKYPQSIVAMARIMAHVGADWTYRSDGYDATNLGLLTGNRERQKAMTMKLVDAAVACGAQTLVLPECGHAYSAMRWMGAEMAGKPLPFRVLHISEFLAGEVASGALRLKKLGKSATFHDPCQLARLGGVIDAPRVVLAALGLELHETFPTKGTNWCCGGGGGVRSIARADALRYRVFHLKMKQINETEAELCVTSCASCRRTFEDGAAHFHWDKTMHSLLELAADNLAEETT
jgi:Fe-S oxidoreductase